MLLKLLLSSKSEKVFLANNYHCLVNTKKGLPAMQIANQGFHTETILVIIFSIHQNLPPGNIHTS